MSPRAGIAFIACLAGLLAALPFAALNAFIGGTAGWVCGVIGLVALLLVGFGVRARLLDALNPPATRQDEDWTPFQ